MAGGRPTKLTDEVRNRATSYYEECIDAGVVPVAAQLAVILDVSKSTLYKWAETDDEFSDTLSKIQTLQEASLVKGGLENKLNPTITKLMLANHGYREKSEIEQNISGELKTGEANPELAKEFALYLKSKTRE